MVENWRQGRGLVKPLAEARVAIVHEWLLRYTGSEQVVAAMLDALPQADLYALLYDPEGLRGTPLEGVSFKTSFIQSLPGAKKKYQTYLPLMPLAVEQFDLRSYDLIVSSNHAVAKGVLTRADQLHVSYVYTPIRYAWDLYQDYLAQGGLARGTKSWLARVILHYIRLWDAVAGTRVDAYLTLSDYVAKRIWGTYRRPARVIHPPVNVSRYRPNMSRDDFFVAVSRFVPYKRMDLIVEAFTRMNKPLTLIGEGPEFKKAQRIAGPNVKLLGYQPTEVVTDYLQRARAFVFAAEEDFGIALVEAQAAGCPVIAYSRGGALETVVGWPAPEATGVFFDEQTPESLEEAVELFERHKDEFRPDACHRHAERFGQQRFQSEFRSTVEELWSRFQRGERVE
jgi:glycosyltransferase involved in cell wall biosynthesis